VPRVTLWLGASVLRGHNVTFACTHDRRIRGVRLPRSGRRRARWSRVRAPRGRTVPAVVAALAVLTATTGALAGAAGSDAQQRLAAVRDVLAVRAAALLHRDRAAFLGTVDAASPAFLRGQERLFDNLADVPLLSWSSDLDPTGRPVAATAGAGPVWTAPVVLRYALRGVDPTPAAVEEQVSFVRRDAGWRVTAGLSWSGEGGRQLWDDGPVVAVTGARSLVLAHPDQAPLARSLADEADRAVPAVTAVWGTGWPQRVVIIVPSSVGELDALAGGTAHLSSYAAVETVELAHTATGPQPPGAARILVNPAAYVQRSSATGRRVILTHEIAHVAAQSATTSRVPSWLVEGFADYVGFRDSGVPVRVAAGGLAGEVRAGTLPSELPRGRAFAADSARLADSYAAAWLAVRMIAGRYGEAAVVRLYQAVGHAATLDPAVALRDGLAAVLGTTPQRFTADWLDYLRAQLG